MSSKAREHYIQAHHLLMLKHKNQEMGLCTKTQKQDKAIGKRRFVVKHTFGTLKHAYGLTSTRYSGLEKVASEVNLKAIAYNLMRVANVYTRKDLVTT